MVGCRKGGVARGGLSQVSWKAPLLKAGSHGGQESCGEAGQGHVQPQVILILLGEGICTGQGVPAGGRHVTRCRLHTNPRVASGILVFPSPRSLLTARWALNTLEK